MPAPSKLNVLFIGNSFTARNDLPGMISALAVLATGFLWSTRPATLPADDEEEDGGP